MCGSMVDIQSAAAEIRRGIKKRRQKETTGQKYNVKSAMQGGHKRRRNKENHRTKMMSVSAMRGGHKKMTHTQNDANIYVGLQPKPLVGWKPVSDRIVTALFQSPQVTKSSALAEMGNRGHNRHGPKRGSSVPLSRRAWTSSNTM